MKFVPVTVKVKPELPTTAELTLNDDNVGTELAGGGATLLDPPLHPAKPPKAATYNAILAV